MGEAPVHIVPYDGAWPEMFAAERDRLNDALCDWLTGSIEHIGSTAVVGLSAKPVIDIMVGVESLPASVAAKPVMRELGYQYANYKADVMHWFCKPSFELRTHHVHLVPHESPLWNERLRFRDLLRANTQLAEEYASLKRELAHRYQLDREAYTEAKWPFITRALELGASR